MHSLPLLTQQIPADWTWLGTYSCSLQPLTVLHKDERIWDSASVFFQPRFCMNHGRHVCSGAAVLQRETVAYFLQRSVNHVSWAVTTRASELSRAERPISSPVHRLQRRITQMKQAQTVSSYKIRNCIWQFLNKCIQVQLKAFQFCQVLVE